MDHLFTDLNCQLNKIRLIYTFRSTPVFIQKVLSMTVLPSLAPANVSAAMIIKKIKLSAFVILLILTEPPAVTVLSIVIGRQATFI